MRVLAKDIKDYAGKEITISGWVHRIRELGGVSFIIMRDRTGMVQIVTNDDIDLTVETVVSISGLINENEKPPAVTKCSWVLWRFWRKLLRIFPFL